jgi:hypothetical protein
VVVQSAGQITLTSALKLCSVYLTACRGHSVIAKTVLLPVADTAAAVHTAACCCSHCCCLQFFNTLFWQCSIGICVDKNVDDVGFIEKVMQDLPNRLAVNKGQVG